jgi:hypothetical protein
MPASPEEQSSRRDNWHQSSVDTALGCPRRYALEYEIGLVAAGGGAAMVGTAIHAGLEVHEVARAQGLTSTIEEVIAAAETTLEWDLAKNAGAFDEATMDKMRSEIKPTIENWWSGPTTLDGWEGSARDWVLQHTPVATETYLRAAVLEGTAPLAGTLDGLYRHGVDGTLFMLDWKTTGSLSNWKSPDDHRHQATFYSLMLLLGDEYPELESMPPMVYVAIRRGRIRKTTPAAAIVTVTPDIQDAQELGQRVRQAEQIKAEGIYPANPLYTWCKTCPFRPLCAPGTAELLVPIEQLSSYAGTAWRDRLPPAA